MIYEEIGLKSTDYKTCWKVCLCGLINSWVGLNFAPTHYFLYALGQVLNSFKPRFPTNEVRHLKQIVQSFHQLCCLPDNLRILICWVLVMKS